MVILPETRDRLFEPVSPTSSTSSWPSDSQLVTHLSRHAANAPSDQDVTVAVVGVGFVGESLLSEFSKVFPAIGYDISTKRIEELAKSGQFEKHVELTTDSSALARATHYLISVPTLLRADRSINLDYVYAALQAVLAYARRGSTIVIESSVSVGTTRQLLGPHRHRFHCGMSPERVDPGRSVPAAAQIPKIISGLGDKALKEIARVYDRVFERTVPVSKPEVAEMTKLYENCYRMINIAYVNEMSDACRTWGIDPYEMIDAAATKPYGFQAFQPGLGVGGHCIPVNPFYLLENNKNLPVLERATKLMWSRPKKLSKKFHRRCIIAASAGTGSPRNSFRPAVLPRILVVGIGFKPGQSVLSCSPGISFAQSLKALGCARLAFFDPLVQKADVPWMGKMDSEAWNKEYIEREFDGVAICMRQQGVDFTVLEALDRTFVRSFVQ